MESKISQDGSFPFEADPRSLVDFDSDFQTVAIGVHFDRRRSQARANSVAFYGSPQRNSPEILQSDVVSLPPALCQALSETERESTTVAQRSQLRAELASIAVQLVQNLMAKSSDPDDIAVIGLHGDGVWQWSSEGCCTYESLSTPSEVAEQTGVTVIDDFPGRDLAQGGRGGPVLAHGYWLMLADRAAIPGRRWRALLDISRDRAHFTSIPPIQDLAQRESLSSADIALGGRLFDELLLAYGSINQRVESVSHLAAQGRVIRELAELWGKVCPQTGSWNPNGISALPLVYALRDSNYNNAPLNDLLATATHFVAREIVIYINHRVDVRRPIGELFIMGPASNNELLIRSIQDQLPVIRIRRFDNSVAANELHASAVAGLAMLHLWQVPLPISPGGEVPRVLGRLTPGNPNNWQRVLRVMTSNAPWLLPLREAI